MGKPSNFSWLREGVLAGSGLPDGDRAFRWLKRHGVTAIISLTEQSLKADAIGKLGIKYYHFPMVNREPEQAAKLNKAMDIVDKETSAGGKVLVHCLAGQGRTGMLLASYLVRKEGMTADEAIKEVQELRPTSLQRVKQREAVREYERKLKSPSPNT